MMTNQENVLRPLLDYLAIGRHPEEQTWQGWHICPIIGGRNNLLYRVTNGAGDFAVKFTIRDARDRAGREFGALTALQQAGLSLAPVPVLLDRDSYALPVVVQTWIEGENVDAAPKTDAAWEALVRYLAALHTVTPDKVAVDLQTATINAYNATEGRQLVQQHTAYIPQEERPESLREILRRFEEMCLPDWPDRVVRLLRLDCNTLNFIHNSGEWASVDWENSGWGDPAFEIADWMMHAAYLDVPASRWQWVTDLYCRLVDDATMSVRIWTYYKITTVWWVVRMARYLYEMPRGLDVRLVNWSEAWLDDVRWKYEHYLHLAEAALS